jgi:hypothetical protein
MKTPFKIANKDSGGVSLESLDNGDYFVAVGCPEEVFWKGRQGRSLNTSFWCTREFDGHVMALASHVAVWPCIPQVEQIFRIVR